MKNVNKILGEFGLTQNETAVYLESIKHSEISPFKLARLTGIARTTVYDVMMSLALKGLITIKTSQGLEKQQSWIVAKNPSVLRDTIFKRRQELTRLEVDIVDILSDLKSGYLAHENNASMKFYPGMQGINTAYALLKEVPPEVQILFFDHMMPMDTLGKEYVNREVSQSLRGREGKKRVKTIMPLNDWTRHVLSYQYGRSRQYIDYHEYRYIESPGFDLKHDMYVFLDRVMFVCAKDNEIWAAVLKSKLVSSSFRAIFNILWASATPVTEQFVKTLGKNEFLKAEQTLHH